MRSNLVIYENLQKNRSESFVNIGSFTIRRQKLANDILEHYRKRLYDGDRFDQRMLELELKECWDTGYQFLKQVAHEMLLSSRFRYLSIYFMEDGFPCIVSEHKRYLQEVYGGVQKYGSEKNPSFRHKFWEFFQEVIVKLDTQKSNLLSQENILEKYRKILFRNFENFYAPGLREELLMCSRHIQPKINPRDVERLMFSIVKSPQHSNYHVALRYLTLLGERCMIPLVKAYRSDLYFRNNTVVNEYWEEFRKIYR